MVLHLIGPLGWCSLFLSILGCCAYSLALFWVASLCPILVLRLIDPMGWRSLFASILGCSSYLWPSCVPSSGPIMVWGTLSLPISDVCTYSLVLGLVPRPTVLSRLLHLIGSSGAVSSYPFLTVAPIPWPLGWRPLLPTFLSCLLCLPSGRAPSLPVDALILRPRG